MSVYTSDKNKTNVEEEHERLKKGELGREIREAEETERKQ